MVSESELEAAILAKLDPTIRFCAEVSGMIDVHTGDDATKDRVRKMVEHVRREAAAFAVRVESSGPFATAADVERVMRREFEPLALARSGTLDLLERLVERGQLADV